MLRPKLTNFSDFIEKPKPVIPKTKKDVQSEINLYLNILLFMVIIIGCFYLYYRFKYKKVREEETKEKLTHFNNYLNDYFINDMLAKQNNNTYY
jgi:hypothetical protein